MKTHSTPHRSWRVALVAIATSCALGVDSQAAPFAWGHNAVGQLGDGTNTTRTAPVAVDVTGVLAGKTVTAIAAGANFTAALTSEGRVYAWGYNGYGQLGNGTGTSSRTPVEVSTTGVLSGKTVTAIAAGANHCLALTTEGKVYAWGSGSDGSLGNGSTSDSSVPVAVTTTGALLGKVITAISAGGGASMALSSDGYAFTWGSNISGMLGDGSTIDRSSPVAVATSGVLSGKTIVAIAMGYYHSLAVSSTGSVYAWGYNNRGQLGNGSTSVISMAVRVDTSSALSGKIISAVAAGQYHSLALSTDGLVYAWGSNTNGQLGDGSTTQRNTAIAVDTSGCLATKVVTAIACGDDHSAATTTDGLICAWGGNSSGQLGNTSTSDATTPSAVTTTGVLSGMSVTTVSAGGSQTFCLAIPASTTISPANRFNYAANFGWLNWRWSASAADAPIIGNDFLAGKVYATNVGWIDLGDGSPSGMLGHYSQTGSDIGVNNDGAGNLTGYAYAANIGWITFDPTIAVTYRPRVDIVTGVFTGYAYSANCGWIELAGIKSSITPGTDTPAVGGGAGNGLADSWERERAIAAGLGDNLGLLANTPGADYDQDGISDADEYLADTNPFDPNDRLHVTSFNYNPLTHEATLDWNGSNRRAFTLLYSYDLTHWTADATTAPGSGANLIMTGQPSPQLFFKVRAQLPLAPTGDPGI